MILGGALLIRYIFDAFMPPRDYGLRAALLTYTIFSVCLAAGFVGRYGRGRFGPVRLRHWVQQ
jgi:hypothetical protein